MRVKFKKKQYVCLRAFLGYTTDGAAEDVDMPFVVWPLKEAGYQIAFSWNVFFADGTDPA